MDVRLIRQKHFEFSVAIEALELKNRLLSTVFECPYRFLTTLLLIFTCAVGINEGYAQSKPDSVPAESAASAGSSRKLPLLEATIRRLEAEKEVLETALTDASSTNQRQSARNSEVDAEVTELQLRLARSDRELGRLADLKNRLNIMLDKYGLTEDTLEDYLQRSGDQANELVVLREASEAAIESLSDQSRINENAILEEQSRLTAELSEYQSRLALLQKSSAEQRAILDNAGVGASGLQRFIEDSLANKEGLMSANALIVDLKNQLVSVQNQLRQSEELSEDSQALERRLQALEDSEDALRSEAFELKDELTKSREALYAAEQQLLDMNTIQAEKNDELDAESRQAINALEIQVTTLTAQNETLEQQLGQMDIVLAQYGLDEQGLSAALASMQSEQSELQTALIEQADLQQQIVELQDQLDDKEVLLEESKIQPNNTEIEPSSTVSVAVTESVVVSPTQVVKAAETISIARLNDRWAIELGSNGPLGYVGIDEANALKSALPAETDCDGLAEGYVVDEQLPRKLSINGFPVSGFWVIRNSGQLALCRVSNSANGEFRASVSRQPPSRTEKALTAVAY